MISRDASVPCSCHWDSPALQWRRLHRTCSSCTYVQSDAPSWSPPSEDIYTSYRHAISFSDHRVFKQTSRRSKPTVSSDQRSKKVSEYRLKKHILVSTKHQQQRAGSTETDRQTDSQSAVRPATVVTAVDRCQPFIKSTVAREIIHLLVETITRQIDTVFIRHIHLQTHNIDFLWTTLRTSHSTFIFVNWTLSLIYYTRRVVTVELAIKQFC